LSRERPQGALSRERPQGAGSSRGVDPGLAWMIWQAIGATALRRVALSLRGGKRDCVAAETQSAPSGRLSLRAL
jgi:hypothetical protein